MRQILRQSFVLPYQPPNHRSKKLCVRAATVSVVQVLTLFATAGVSLMAPLASIPPPVDFSRDIQPMLEKRCYSCHSRLKQKSDLRLDAGALIHKGGTDRPLTDT